MKSSKHRKGPSRSLPPMGTPGKISELLLGPEQRAEAPGPPLGKWLLLSKSNAPHDPKLVTTCASILMETCLLVAKPWAHAILTTGGQVDAHARPLCGVWGALRPRG